MARHQEEDLGLGRLAGGATRQTKDMALTMRSMPPTVEAVAVVVLVVLAVAVCCL